MDFLTKHYIQLQTHTDTSQSFVGGIVSFRALPRPQFAVLQSRLFPIYFSLQTTLPVLMALTYPSTLPTNSYTDILNPSLGSTVLYPLLTVFVSSFLNLAIVGPATTKVMRERKGQESRDGKKSYDAPPHSKEMVALNKKFGKLHGASSLLNLACFLATIWYGVGLSARL